MIDDLVGAVGIPTDLPAAEKAAALVRAFPLRQLKTVGARDLKSVVESRWFADPAECLRLLVGLFRGHPRRGRAFGTSWPYLEAGGRWVAPALPVAVGAAEMTGPDGCYRLRDGVVWREAGGGVRPLLSVSEMPSAPDVGFDVLWFGDAERYLLRSATLEVEDLFSVYRVAATARVVDVVLFRERRVDRELLSGVELSEQEAPAEIAVRRSRELLTGDRYRDPEATLSVRVDIRHVERQGDQLLADTELGERGVFNVVEEPHGWRLYTWEGRYPLRSLALTETSGDVRYSATIRSEVDPLTPGLRSRLAFDLRADLTALASS
jgi:hypothetical protein